MLVEIVDPTIATVVEWQIVVVLVTDKGVVPWVGRRAHFDTPAPDRLNTALTVGYLHF